MFGSDTLDIVVGLVFVYLLASLIVSATTELIAGWLGWRANKLFDGIKNLLNSPQGQDWAQMLYNHPLIQGLLPLPTKTFAIGKFKLAPLPPGPSYIPPRAFSSALLDLIQNLQPTVGNVAKELQGALNAASGPGTSASDVKSAILLIARSIPVASPPSGLEARLSADLQALAGKIPDSDSSLRQLIAGIQDIISKIPDADPALANLKTALQSLMANVQSKSASVDQLKIDLQTLINGITASSTAILLVKGAVQTLINHVPGTADSAAIAMQLLQVFVNDFWGRYLPEIIDQIPDAKLRTALAALLQQSGQNVEKFREAVEGWFNAAMGRVSGWYKRHTQWVNLLLGIALTFALNLDSVLILRVLSEDNSGLLKAVVAEAEKFTEHPPVVISTGASPQSSPTPAAASSQQPANNASANSPDLAETLRLLKTQFNALSLPVGWIHLPPVTEKAGATQTAGNRKPKASFGENSDFRQWPGWTWQGTKFPRWLSKWRDTIAHHFIGWLLTVIALSLGAPFWFDLLSKFMSIRASGDQPKQQAKTPKDGASATTT